MTNFNMVVPCFSVADVGKTMRWYEEQLGFAGDPFPDREPYLFAILLRDGVEVMLQRIAGYEKPNLYPLRSVGVWDAYFRIEGVEEFYNQIRDCVDVIKPISQKPYGAWEFEVRDPDGYVLVFSEFR